MCAMPLLLMISLPLPDSASRPLALLCIPCSAVQWFGDCRRLLGVRRVLLALVTAVAIAYSVLPPEAAARVLIVTGVGTLIAGQYGQSVLGGVMGDFLGATICVLEVAIYLALSLIHI